MSNLQGNTSPYTGYQVPNYQPGSQYYGGNTLQRPNDSSWGGPQLRANGLDVGQNMQWAGQNLPNSPYWMQTQAAGYYGAPFASNPMEYGRWNWASPMSAQQPQQQPQQQPYTPPAQTTPTQPSAGGASPVPGIPQPVGPTTPTYAPIAGVGNTIPGRPSSAMGSNNWWAAVANAQKPGTDLPDWLAGSMKRV